MKKMFFQLFVGTREVLLRMEDRVRNFLALLSAIAVALVVANELLPPDTKLPLMSLQWGEVQAFLRGSIWFAFVVYCVTYGLAAKNKFEYLRTHLLELLICVAWLPHYQSALHHLTSVLSITALQLAGSLAHAWRVARWTIRRFNTHPLIVTGAAALVLVATASAVLNQVEPQTFPTVWDAAWYCLATVTTVGYGDLAPKTPVGRAVGAVLMMSGISLAGVFIGLMTELVHKRLMKRSSDKARQSQPAEDASDKDDSPATQEQILAELQTNNKLLAELVAEMRKANGRTPDDKPSAPAPDTPAEGK